MTRSAVARSLIGVAALLMVLTGCVAGNTGTASSAPPTPLIDQDFPDPDIVHSGGQYVAFATNSPAYAIQEATSPDLTHWNYRGDDALPQARLILDTAEKSFRAGDIEYVEYVVNTEPAWQIQSNYLDQVQRYNEVVLALQALTSPETP